MCRPGWWRVSEAAVAKGVRGDSEYGRRASIGREREREMWGTGEHWGLSPNTSVDPTPADGCYLNYRRLPWQMKVIDVTSVGLPPTDGC
jgi:hypothetical protein